MALRPLLAGLTVAFWILAASAAEPEPAPLTDLSAVKSLPRDEAARSLPVRVEGVVTANDAVGGIVIQDSVGVYINHPPPTAQWWDAKNLMVGDLIAVEGKTNPGRFSPVIVPSRIDRLGRAPLPTAKSLTIVGMRTGIFDCQRIQIEGIVQAVFPLKIGPSRFTGLNISTVYGPILYGLTDSSPLPSDDLIDAEVRLTGVCLTFFNTSHQFTGLWLCSNDPRDIQILSPPPGTAFAALEVPLSTVLGFSPTLPDLRRRRVKGTVTLSNAGAYFYLQTGEHALRVNTRQRGELKPGQQVEAAGFFGLTDQKGQMHEAVFRVIGRDSPPTAVEVNIQDVLWQPTSIYSQSMDFQDYFIAIQGKLLSVENWRDETLRLHLDCDGVLVPVDLPNRADSPASSAFEIGSELKVSGVCVLQFSEAGFVTGGSGFEEAGQTPQPGPSRLKTDPSAREARTMARVSNPILAWPRPNAVQLLPRGIEDIQVIKPAPRWTPRRLAIALSIGTVALLVVAVWVILLRRTVAIRSGQLASEMRAHRDATVRFETTLQERTRLAADLHDTIEQTLTGLALQFEASEALREIDSAQSGQHRKLASQLLSRSREELRRSIWNLHHTSYGNGSFVEGLRQVAADRGTELRVPIEVVLTGQPRSVSDFVAGNLLLLVQECIHNAAKHAKPTRIDVSLSISERAITLEIRDNGCGFNVSTAVGPGQGHFGLQGMRERIKRLGGTIKIISAPGAGTCIAVVVPE